jgi:hypothetical protein
LLQRRPNHRRATISRFPPFCADGQIEVNASA